MDTIQFYTDLGFWHVMDWQGLDHLYFIVTLALPFAFKALRQLIGWVTLFTLGHTLSLIGNFYAEISISGYVIELLIPITIALSAIHILLPNKKKKGINNRLFFGTLTLLFGIIHGLGFGRYFQLLLPEDAVSTSLFSFALGVELAQIAIVLGVLVLNRLVLHYLKWKEIKWSLFVGAMILSQALGMIVERV